MEPRLLSACAEQLRRDLLPRVQIIDGCSILSSGSELLLERPGEDARRARLVIDLSPRHATCYVSRARPGHRPEDPFHHQLIGRWITGVSEDEAGSILRLHLTDPGADGAQSELIYEWLGGNPDALIVETDSGRIVAGMMTPRGAHAARRSRGTVYEEPPPPYKPLYEKASRSEILQALASGAGRPPIESLRRGLAGVTLPIAYEAIAQGKEDHAAIAAALERLREAKPAPTLYRTRGEVPDLPAAFVSSVLLPSLEPYRAKRTDPLFVLLKDAHEAILKVEQESSIRETYLRILQDEERRLMRLYRHLEEEKRAAGEADTLRRQAESLLVHVSRIDRGAESFSCPDPHDADRTLEIDLDPTLSVPENADQFFRRARRLARGEPLRRKRLAAVEEAIANLSVLRQRAEKTGGSLAEKGAAWLGEALGRLANRRAIDRWKETVASFGTPTEAANRKSPAAAKPKKIRKQQPAGFHPRVYKTSDGWTVVVGRSNAENDHVTHSIARPEDYWFHAQGCPGSHVVLRREGRKDNPSKRTIEEAAAIAAFFSKARSSRKAPVAYTLKKYVRKPRKAPPGLAEVMREKTIMVEPKAPETNQDGGWGEET